MSIKDFELHSYFNLKLLQLKSLDFIKYFLKILLFL